MLVGSWALAPSRPWGIEPQPTAGSIAARDFVAPHDALVLDREATATKQRRAREEVLPVYDFDPAASTRAVEELERLFALGRNAAEEAAATTSPSRSSAPPSASA